MRGIYRSALALFAMLPATALAAQVVDRVIPNAAAAGDLIIIEGNGLLGLVSTTVEFTADVGGVPGIFTLSVAPLSVTATQITATVPTLGFAPPSAARPGLPMGRIRVTADEIGSNELSFFYMQPTLLSPTTQLSTPGNGTTQSTGLRSVVSFDLAGGPPTPGNGSFVMELENAVPSTVAVLMLGLPDSPPFAKIGDGDFVLDLQAPILVLPPVALTPQGEASLPMPIPGPGPLGIALVAQWALIDAGIPSGIAVSNGLRFTL